MSVALRPFRPFEMEGWQSAYEHEVDFNLADSGVRCAPLGFVLDADDLERLANVELFYPPVNGSDALRQRIADLYRPVASENEVLVTVGAAEANALVCHTLLERGDHVTVIEPGYRQVRGLAENLGCTVDVVQLHHEDGWALDTELLRRAVGPRTKLVYAVNPNNPTGTIFSADARAALIDAIDTTGAWLLADEVYRGSERDGVETPSFWGMHPRVICTDSLSKAYGLCGLRVGWVVAPRALLDDLWRRHEYAVISTSLPGVFAAERALLRRDALLARQRELVRAGTELYERWLGAHSHLISAHPTQATALSFPRYACALPSHEVADAVRARASVLVVPGAMMGSEGHFRLAVGFEPEFLQAALERLGSVLEELT